MTTITDLNNTEDPGSKEPGKNSDKKDPKDNSRSDNPNRFTV